MLKPHVLKFIEGRRPMYSIDIEKLQSLSQQGTVAVTPSEVQEALRKAHS